MPTTGWVTVLPPVMAIVLAIASRQVYLSLAAGTWLGWTIVAGWDPFAGLSGGIEGVVAVLGDAGNARVVLFTLVIGALIATVEASGGVRGFVNRLEQSRLVQTPRGAQLMVIVAGIIVFIESNITILVCGALGRPIFDRMRISREKLAYLVDSTSAPVCILIPLNAWGAFVLGVLATLDVPNPLGTFVSSIALNFYAIAALLLAIIVALFNINLGPMRKAEARTQGGELLWPNAQPMVDPDVIAPPAVTTIPPRAINMLLPIGAMVLMMPTALFITGDGDLRAGSGSTSVLWSVLIGLLVAWVLLLAQRGFTIDQLVRTGLKGAGGLVGLALVLMLALSLSDVTKVLGTGAFIAEVSTQHLPRAAMLPLMFVVASVVAFCTGTSWGTFGIMLPIAVPAAMALDLPLAPFVAAVLSGGVFGDHCSPISDTTIIASMASATDHIDHVRTQLPYALIAAAVAVIAFSITGLVI